MKSLEKLSVLVFFSLITACGGSDGGGSSKSIFSRWTTEDNTVSVDFTGQNFGQTFALDFILGTGARCRCSSVFVVGTESTGNIAISSCTYQGGGTDPGCSMFQNSGQPYKYDKSGSNLRICYADNSCENWK